ncbi:MAG: hypothetical protein ACKO4Y_03415 [Flavobacteriales bacterium]
MLRISLIGFLAAISFCSFGQKILSTPIGSPEILFSENGVSISAQLTECNNESRNELMTYKILSITNSNAAPAALKIREDMYYDLDGGNCRTCENPEYTFTFNLEAGETKAGNCYSDSHPALAVFVSMKDGYIKEVLSDLKMNIVRLH